VYDVYSIRVCACTGFQRLKGWAWVAAGGGQIETGTCGSKRLGPAEKGVDACFFGATSRISFMGAVWVW
jgi:hypothetical protein